MHWLFFGRYLAHICRTNENSCPQPLASCASPRTVARVSLYCIIAPHCVNLVIVVDWPPTLPVMFALLRLCLFAKLSRCRLGTNEERTLPAAFAPLGTILFLHTRAKIVCFLDVVFTHQTLTVIQLERLLPNVASFSRHANIPHDHA
jgi:hypothetical protein